MLFYQINFLKIKWMAGINKNKIEIIFGILSLRSLKGFNPIFNLLEFVIVLNNLLVWTFN